MKLKLLTIILSICLLTSCVVTDTETDISSSISEISEQSSEQSEESSQEPIQEEDKPTVDPYDWMEPERARWFKLEDEVRDRRDRGLFTNQSYTMDAQIVNIGETFLGWELSGFITTHVGHSDRPKPGAPPEEDIHGGSHARFSGNHIVRGVVEIYKDPNDAYWDPVSFYPDEVYVHMLPTSGTYSPGAVLGFFTGNTDIDMEKIEKEILEALVPLLEGDYLEYSIELTNSTLSLDDFPIQKEVEGGIVAMNYSPVWGISDLFYFDDDESTRIIMGYSIFIDFYEKYPAYNDATDEIYEIMSQLLNPKEDIEYYYCEVEMVGYSPSGTQPGLTSSIISKVISFEKLEDNPYAFS